MSAGPIRVLVVDDSALMRKLIPQVLARNSSIHVVGTAMDGSFGLKKIAELKPDVITLDLEMPRMNGMEMLREIMRSHRLPVIVVSAQTQHGAFATFKALALGAFDFVAKPADVLSGGMEEIAAELAAKIKVAAMVGAPKFFSEAPAAPSKKKVVRARKAPAAVVAIGVSTGGPNALQYLFSHLPADFAGGILVVQHMPEGFTEMFARRLDETSCLEVREARSGDILTAGQALICPGNRHIKIRKSLAGALVALDASEKVNGHRPSADVLFRSVAQEFGPRAIALIMTGMGEDGAEGLGVVLAAGGLTIAQSEESCAVNGMPRAAIERGYVSRIVHLEALASLLHARCATKSEDPRPVTPLAEVREP